MAESIYGYGVSCELLAADGTVYYVIVATRVLTVGGYAILYYGLGLGVAVCRSKLCLTYGTELGLGAGRLVAGCVAKSGSKLCLTYRTELRLGAGRLVAGSMAEGVAINVVTSLAIRSLGAGRINEIVAERLTVSESTYLAIFRSSTGRVYPRVVTKSSDEGYIDILDYSLKLYRIDLKAVLDLFIKYGDKLEVDRILNTDHKVKSKVVAMLYGKSVSKDELAVGIRNLNGNGIYHLGNGHVTKADVTYIVLIKVNVGCSIYLCSA